MMLLKVVIEAVDDPDAAMRALEASSQSEWLKAGLAGVALRREPFAIPVNSETEASELMERLGSLGFRCRLDTGPDWTQEVASSRAAAIGCLFLGIGAMVGAYVGFQIAGSFASAEAAALKAQGEHVCGLIAIPYLFLGVGGGTIAGAVAGWLTGAFIARRM